MIFFFSGTGNTRWAAQQMAATAGEYLLFIPDELKGDCHYHLSAGERLGFCFPVHGWQPPHIVRQFIRKSTFEWRGKAGETVQQPYVFALVTCGDSIGLTMEMLARELQPKGIRPDALFSLVMPESYVCLPFMYTDSPEREQAKISRSTEELRHYAQMVAQRRCGEGHTKRGLTPWVFSHVIGAYFNGHMISDGKFTVDADRCIGCGKCQEVCPTGDLLLTADRRPSWQHDGSCTCCLACYHHCPHHAINYGSITRKRGQYYFGHKQ